MKVGDFEKKSDSEFCGHRKKSDSKSAFLTQCTPVTSVTSKKYLKSKHLQWRLKWDLIRFSLTLLASVDSTTIIWLSWNTLWPCNNSVFNFCCNLTLQNMIQLICSILMHINFTHPSLRSSRFKNNDNHTQKNMRNSHMKTSWSRL
jgi:amino acid transporter